MTSFTSPVSFAVWFFFLWHLWLSHPPACAWTPALMSAPTHELSRKAQSLIKPKDKIYKTKKYNIKQILPQLYNNARFSCLCYMTQSPFARRKDFQHHSLDPEAAPKHDVSLCVESEAVWENKRNIASLSLVTPPQHHRVGELQHLHLSHPCRALDLAVPFKL